MKNDLLISAEKICYHFFGGSISCSWKETKSIKRNVKHHFGTELLLQNWSLEVWKPCWFFGPTLDNTVCIPLLFFDLN
ncbi:MAG: hypothetical protein P8X78_01975, partial [Nitrosopumilaceae archaeon]